MRAMKSILGSTLEQQSTEVGDGHAERYQAVIGACLRHLREPCHENRRAMHTVASEQTQVSLA